MNIPEDLINDILDASRIIVSVCPDRAAEAAKLRRAIDAHSPILNTRFRVMLDNALPSTEFTPEDKQLFGEIMIRLGDLRKGGPGRPVGSGDDRTITKRVRLTPEEDRQLNQRVSDSGETFSQYARRRLLQD